MPKRPAPLPPLGELEELVLDYLWQNGEGDVISAHLQIGKRRGITLNTVGSSFERLYRKGLVRRRKVSHAYRYEAALDREIFRARRLAMAAGGAAQLADHGLLAAFVDLVSEADSAALDRLETLIARKRSGSKS